MNEKLKALYEKINAKKQEIRDLVEAGDNEQAKAAKAELKTLSEQFDLLYDLDDEAAAGAAQKAAAGAVQKAADKKKNVLTAFVNAVKAGLKGKQVDEESREILNSMTEGSDEDGGLTVPKDLRTQIKELRRSGDALENLVNVEHVTTNSGSRVVERYADSTPFDNVEEEAEFSEVSTPQFDNVEYKVKKKGGILRVSAELLADTAENILAYLKKWIAKKSKATRNFMIVAKIKEMCKDAEVNISCLDDLKDIYNEQLDPAIEELSVCVTNQTGFNWMDKLKDSDGKYILQPDPTQPTKKLLFGVYPITKISNKILKNVNGKAPIICGCLKEAITIFDRENMYIDINDKAGSLWSKDQTGIKVRERLDIQTVDAEAVVLGYVGKATDTDGDGKYSEAELNKMTKQDIVDLASDLGYTMTKTVDDTKADIITEFLAQQTAASA